MAACGRARYLMHDRDPLYTLVFGEILEGGGVQPIRLPPKSPNLNADAERFVRSIKEECLSRVVPLGEGHVRLLVGEYVEHYHRERNHQGLDNQLLQRPPPPVSLAADVQRRERLGGIAQFLPPGGRMSGRPIKRTLRGHEPRPRAPAASRPSHSRPGGRVPRPCRLATWQELGIAAVPHGFRSSFRDWAVETDEHTPRSGRGRTRPYGTEPHRGGLRPQ